MDSRVGSERKANTGISTLRIDFNRKDGYYFHITQSQLGSVPDHFYRKATLKNSERFGSKELAEIEEIMLEAREKSSILEYDLLRKYVQKLNNISRACRN